MTRSRELVLLVSESVNLPFPVPCGGGRELSGSQAARDIERGRFPFSGRLSPWAWVCFDDCGGLSGFRRAFFFDV